MDKLMDIVSNAHAYANEFDKELDKIVETHMDGEFEDQLDIDMHFATIKADYDYLAQRFTDEEIAEMNEQLFDFNLE